MKVTKYPQSCLLLEKDGRRIVIDPGNFFAAKYGVEELGQVEAVLYKHQHADHFDETLVTVFEEQGAKLYGNAAVAGLIGPAAIKVTSDVSFEAAGFKVMPHDIPHFQKPGVEMPPNTGYIVDGNFFHPGDGIINIGVTVDNFAAPVAGPFGFDIVVEFIESVGAKKVIPIHYTNQELYPCDPQEFVNTAHDVAEIIMLQDGQSAEI